MTTQWRICWAQYVAKARGDIHGIARAGASASWPRRLSREKPTKFLELRTSASLRQRNLDTYDHDTGFNSARKYC
jgi:hypothetical protein